MRLCNFFRLPFILFLVALVFAGAKSQARERDRVAGDFSRMDANKDGKLSQEEWERRGNFTRLDADGDGHLSLTEVRSMYAGHGNKLYDWPPANFRRSTRKTDSSAGKDRIAASDIDSKTFCAITRRKKCNPKAPVKRGLFATGLGPVFPKNTACPSIDDYYALDYTFKRSREAYHGGIDLPVRWGTPVIAAAAGTVVSTFKGENSPRGIEIVIRHAPEDTGLPIWIYTGYGHLDKMPDLKVGQRVRRGEILGPTGNSGVSGNRRKKKTMRRPAIHFSAMSSENAKYAVKREIVIPIEGQWIDPMALYRQKMPVDSHSMKVLPEKEKSVSVPVLYEDGEVFPADTKFVWPYICGRD